jgi:hypothetical protein
VADGFMSEVVRRFTPHDLVSCDLDPKLGPDVAASGLALPFATDAFVTSNHHDPGLLTTMPQAP